MQGRRTKRSRRLAAEALERRDLLAGDAGFSLAMSFAHNFVHPEDVDQSNSVTPFDAMAVVAAIRAGETTGANGHFPDVNGDNRLTVFDPFLVMGAVRAQLEQSQAPLQNRIDRLQEALAAGVLPDDMAEGEAERVLETLENGGRPELGEEILPSRFDELRDSPDWGLANEVLAALEEAGVETARARDWIQDIRAILPGSETPIRDLVDEVFTDGSDAALIRTIEENIGDDTGQVSRWVEQIRGYLPADDASLQGVFEQLRSDNIDGLTDELLAALEAEGVELGEARQWIEDFRTLAPADSETPWLDVLGRLRSDQTDLADDIVTILEDNGVATGDAREWIDDLGGLLPETDTPWLDLVEQLRSDQAGSLAQELLTILEDNGVDTANADVWVDDFVALLPDSETPYRDLLRELQSEDGDETLDEILGVFDANGVGTTEARSWIDDILTILPASERPLADYLETLDTEDGRRAALDDILALLDERNVNTAPALPWIDLADELLGQLGDDLLADLDPLDVVLEPREWRFLPIVRRFA